MKRVLIVEDNPLWAELLGRYATNVGAIFRTAVSPGQALELLDEWPPDIIVLDLLLTGETGMALLHELRSHEDLARIPIVVCSSVEVTDRQLQPYGVAAVLDKARMLPDDMIMVLRRLLT